ncbi:MAG: flagellar hook protein FlgE [Phycisphaerales bacterium]
MPSMTSLFTGLSGLNANARKLDTIGNNIANVNTTAFKSNRMIFAPTFSRTFSLGTAPNENTGGSNPGQVGLGVSIAGTQRNFNNGSISTTGVSTDIAIEGDGFFIAERAGQQLYTRAGSFQRNERNDLVTISGEQLLGYEVDSQFNVVRGNLKPLNVPLGTLTLAEATRNVVFNGNLNASGPKPTTGSVHTTRQFFTDVGLTNPADPTTDLTDPSVQLYIDDGSGGQFLAFQGGEPGAAITIRGAEKGGKDLGEQTFQFSAAEPVAGIDETGQTMDDLLTWLDSVLGLSSVEIDGQDLGGGIRMENGAIVVEGNEGVVQDLDLESGDFTVTNNGAGIGTPFFFNRSAVADGESVRTSFFAFDSLGTPLNVDLTYVLQDTQETEGTTWQFIAESTDTAESDRIVGLGTVKFDSNGRFVSATNQSVTLSRDNGAVSPLVVDLEFDSGSDAITALTDTASNLAAVFQDGSAIGTLTTFSIGETGLLTGAFTNGLTRTIGQVAIGKFSNPEGLVDIGNNLFGIGPNSGDPIITEPLNFGTGRLLGGALELSNVDLSQEFIDMILTSTGYSASSRVIQTTDELIDQLLVLGR